MQIQIKNLSFSYSTKLVLSDISVDIAEKQRWAIIGKNGAGKSTLIRCIAGLEKASSGSIMICGKNASDYGKKDLARLIAYVPQAHEKIPHFSVYQYVLMGRFPYQGFMAMASREDIKIAREAMELTDIIELSERHLHTLSGGELQRVFLAGAVSQRTRILLLDEPATYMDPLHQQYLRAALARIRDEFGTTILTVTHDINDAILNYTNVLSIVDGKCSFAGSVQELYKRSPAILKDIYGLEFDTAIAEKSGFHIMFPFK